MNKIFLPVTSLFMGISAMAQNKKDLIKEVEMLRSQLKAQNSELADLKKEKEFSLENEQQKYSYAFGVGMGGNLKSLGVDSLAYNAFAIGMEDVMTKREKMTLEEAQSLVQTTIAARQEAIAKEKSAEGELFLTENAKKPDIVSTETGLQYEIITKGEGPIPTSADKVKVHYTGMLLDGKVFDSSVERGEPITFGVTGVIAGWTEALQLMPVGSKWKLFIPQDLAYGPRGAGGGEIPPYATLIFEVEPLDIEK